MKKLRVGVVGLGMGRCHVSDYKKHKMADVVAIADTNEARLADVGDEFNVPGRYTSVQEMLDKSELNIVSIAVPNSFHKELTVAALEAGCHVLCEKPMALNAAEGEAMIRAADKAGRRLMINFSFRFTSASWFMKRQIEEDMLGEIYHARTVWLRRKGLPGFGGWFGQKQMSGGGPLIDLAVHRLDLALWLMGHPEPLSVLASTSDRLAAPLAAAQGAKYDVEDFGVALLTFKNGATVSVEASWISHIKEQEIMETRILGTKGGLLQRNLREGYEFETELFTERDGYMCDLKPHNPMPPTPSAAAHFVDCIAADRPHMATGQEGLAVTQLLDAIYESARTGTAVLFG